MATRVWLGKAAAVAGVVELSLATVAATDTMSVTINGKTVTHTATSTDEAAEATAFAEALAACTEPEFAELTFEAAGTTVLITGADTGEEFTLTSADSGSLTLTQTTLTAATGPNNWNDAANWSGGAVPVTGDDVIVDASDVPILDGLDQNAVTLASLRLGPTFVRPGQLGRPAINPGGYAEYRQPRLKVGVTAATFDCPECELVRIDGQAVQTTVTVFNGGPGWDWVGTHASNAIAILGGTNEIAAGPAEVATVSVLRVGGSRSGTEAALRCGSGVTLATLHQSGGEVVLNGGATAVNLRDGTLTVEGAGAVTTANLDGGELTYRSTGTIGTLNVGSGGVADFSSDPRARTVTTCTLQAGATLRDPARTVTFTNPITLNRAGIHTDEREGVTLDLGEHITLAVAGA